jgi:quercetin dioxygenase-like cupin family protein
LIGEEKQMRRLSLTARLIALLCILGIGGMLAPRVVAQDATATPAIAVNELAPGVTAEVLGAIPSNRAPGQTVYTARFVFEPGAAIFPHSHPGTASLTVYSGTLGWTLLQGKAYVIRGAAAGNAEISETLTEPNQDVVLNPGDNIYYEDDVVHTARGAGDEPTVVYGTLVLTTGAPLLMPAGMNMATPTP